MPHLSGVKTASVNTVRRAAGLGRPRRTGGAAMPTYEYRCEKCGERFERVEQLAEHEKAKPACPKCASDKVKRVVSAFYAKTSRKS